MRIEDHAMIGNLRTAALVGKDGTIDWLCLPDFDSSACFASLIGNKENGYWRLAPGSFESSEFHYVQDTLVLETTFHTKTGSVKVIDFMVPQTEKMDLIRIVQGVSGTVEMEMDLKIRFDYGSIRPRTLYQDHYLVALGGPDLIRLDASQHISGGHENSSARWTLKEGDEDFFILNWNPSYQSALPPRESARETLQQVIQWWRNWTSHCSYQGEWKEAVRRSLIVLKALTHRSTGGMVAAPTTSLPEDLGGVRNWDYRFCWLRDAHFLISALLSGGYRKEAKSWRDWLLRAVAGNPADLRVLYGIQGQRRLTELTLPWLEGYENSKPVRIGNEAASQRQLDVYGEVMDTLHLANEAGVAPLHESWEFQKDILAHLETIWREPDCGIWEVRGGPQNFVYSKVMCWVAFDRALKAVEKFNLDGPVEQWKKVRQEIHQEVCEKGYNPEMKSFVQFYGSQGLDASLLLLPLVGFLPPTDPRILGTVQAVERNLLKNGFVLRYTPQLEGVDGLPGNEGAFLACSFWLVDNWVLQGHLDKAMEMFSRLMEIRNEIGLLSEEYDVDKRRFVGNFPQAFSHVALIQSATLLSQALRGSERDVKKTRENLHG